MASRCFGSWRRLDQRPLPPRSSCVAVLDVQWRAVVYYLVPKFEAPAVDANDLIVVLDLHHFPMLVGTAVAGVDTDGVLRIAAPPGCDAEAADFQLLSLIVEEEDLLRPVPAIP